MAEEVAGLTFESEEWTRVLKKLKDKWKDIKNRKEFGAIVAIAGFKDILSHFDDELGPTGKWQERSEAYKIYAHKQGKTKILQFSGTLRKSFTPSSPKFRSNTSGIILYSKVPYARAHDEGLGKMPERKFMWLSKDAIDSIIKQTLKWLSEGI